MVLNVSGYVAGKWIGGRFVPMALILKLGETYKVKSHIEMFKDNYGHLTLKRNKFYKDKSAITEGETHDIRNFLKELTEIGLDIIEIHSLADVYDIAPSASDSIVPAYKVFSI